MSMNIIVEIFKIQTMITRSINYQEYEKALSLYDKLINFKYQLSNRLALAKTITDKAYLLKKMNLHNNALNCYLQAAQISKECSNHIFHNKIVDEINDIQKIL